MSHGWMYMAAVVVVVAVLGGSCEDVTIRPSLLGLLNAKEFQTQFDLIDTLLAKLANGSDCSTSMEKSKTKQKSKTPMEAQEEEEEEDAVEDGSEDEDEDKDDDAEMKSEGVETTTEVPEEMCDYKTIHAEHTMLLPLNDDCDVKKTGITDDEKQLILTLHNQLRAHVAEGNETRGDPGPQPSASKMFQLTWNDELATVAQAWASQCPVGHDVERKRRLCSEKYTTGQNINYHWGSLDDGPLWEDAIENWYNEVSDVDNKVAAAFMPDPIRKIGHYTQFIWGTTKEIGCGIVYYETVRKGLNYTNSITHVCNYGPSGNYIRRPFYEQGPPASNCPGNVSMEYPALCL